MGERSNITRWWPRRWPLQPIQSHRWANQRPTYAEARPATIHAALDRALARPAGNWYVVAASKDIRDDRPFARTIADRELVAWRDSRGGLRIGPGACPHLGAPLGQATVQAGELVCRWHGMRLCGDKPGWRALPSYDDGVLAWVRLDAEGGETPTEQPRLPHRPDSAVQLDAVATVVGVCEPRDIIANRLDPWHGAWFHPYSFAALDVLSAPAANSGEDDDKFLVSVTFRLGARLGVPTIAEFTCPEPRTVVMRIVDGEGVGSVVETHATPLAIVDGRPRTAVIEAILAQSGRPGFAIARKLAPAIRPLITSSARRLWRDDLAYAERRYALRAERQ